MGFATHLGHAWRSRSDTGEQEDEREHWREILDRPHRPAERQRRTRLLARSRCRARMDPMHPFRLVHTGRRRHLHHHQQLRLRSGHPYGRIGRPSSSAGRAHAITFGLDCFCAHDRRASRSFGYSRSAYAGSNGWSRPGCRRCRRNGRGGFGLPCTLVLACSRLCCSVFLRLLWGRLAGLR